MRIAFTVNTKLGKRFVSAGVPVEVSDAEAKEMIARGVAVAYEEQAKLEAPAPAVPANAVVAEIPAFKPPKKGGK